MSDGYEVGIGVPIHDTGKALLVDGDGVGKMWIPKAALHDDTDIWKDGLESMDDRTKAAQDELMARKESAIEQCKEDVNSCMGVYKDLKEKYDALWVDREKTKKKAKAIESRNAFMHVFINELIKEQSLKKRRSFGLIAADVNEERFYMSDGVNIVDFWKEHERVLDLHRAAQEKVHSEEAKNSE